MKYLFYYLIAVYYNLLNNAISVGGSYLPVYDAIVPPTENGSYILIGERNSYQIPSKGTFDFDVNILIDVVIKGQGFSFKDSQDAANQIMALINSDANPNCGPYFQVVTTSIQGTNSLTGINQTDLIYRTLVRYHHNVKQLN